jgi:hypothetical protein
MCKPTTTASTRRDDEKKKEKKDDDSSSRTSTRYLLLSLESYNSSCTTSASFSEEDLDADDTTDGVDPRPSMGSCAWTMCFFLSVLIASEQFFRWVFREIVAPHQEVLRMSPTYPQIVARHVGVDALACFTCAILGWKARKPVVPYLTSLQRPHQQNNAKDNSNADALRQQRLYQYHPAAFRIALVFGTYQLKNLYDSYVWKDGPEFIFHHLFSIFTAIGVMDSGIGHVYSIFFFGISEISTAVLCLLANFDDQYGVPQLGQSLPHIKVILGGLFAILFVICRCILWPTASVHLCRDMHWAIQHHAQEQYATPLQCRRRTFWVRFFLISLGGLSILQIAWLGQIIATARTELVALGFISTTETSFQPTMQTSSEL